MTVTVEIVVRNGRTGLIDSQRTLHVPVNSVQPLIEQVETMIATFPPKQIKIVQETNGSVTFIDIEVGRPDLCQNTRPGPTFEALYRAGSQLYNASTHETHICLCS